MLHETKKIIIIKEKVKHQFMKRKKNNFLIN